ncbi:hypothetical protein CAL7716_033340 [Calothrix sp. PCC 7716]|nr:hypothetical protein CAL7716_033340 [Calothrix sp. PCC 7716]
MARSPVSRPRARCHKPKGQLNQDYKQFLGLRDEDIQKIYEQLLSQTGSVINNQQPATNNQQQLEEDDLSSEKGVNYAKLRDLLQAGKWKEADYETYLVMLHAVGREENDWIRNEELLKFPSKDLRTINTLWVKYSDGKFGFSVQKEIYLIVGAEADGKYYEEAWIKLAEKVGWKINDSWIICEEVTYGNSAPIGHLPFWSSKVGIRERDSMRGVFWVGVMFSSLVSRLVRVSI